MSNEIQTREELAPEKSRFVYLLLSGKYNFTELATLLDKHPDTIRRWRKLPEVQEAINEIQDEQNKFNKLQLNALSAEAIHTMMELMSSPIDGVRYQAAKDIMDRTGFKPTQKTEKKVEIVSYEQNMKDLIDMSIDAEYEIMEED